jgi:hypothetical protein
MREVPDVRSARPTDRPRIWQTPEALHIDVRGLEPPEPMLAILQLIDGDEVENALVAYLDREPIFLYPELNERGWAFEILPAADGTSSAENEVRLRMVRL